ncbi:MAG: ORF6N domain-containing protein [Chitinophagales bacterium]|nr:ORF6N domain-containing protein [Chitinophagales bacterium]
MEVLTTMPEEVIMNRIYCIRGEKVMIDRDLADLYGVETKRLKEAVRRNLNRFPEDFMFEMTKDEFELWRNENKLQHQDKRGLRHPPFCFTEQGVTMLSCVLSSERAIAVNIKIIRIFSKMRSFLITNKEMVLKLEELERKTNKNSKQIRLIFQTLRQLIEEPKTERTPIGFKQNG